MRMRDEQNDVYLVEGFMPDVDTISTAWPGHPPFIKKDRGIFDSREEALATTLSARARRLCYHQRTRLFDDPDESRSWPLDTWVLAYPTSEPARLAGWFAEKAPDTDYRLIIHRTPILRPSTRRYEPHELWSQMYRHALSSKKLRLRPQPVPRDLRRSTKPFLQDLLHAYARGPPDVQAVLDQCGHPYWLGQYIPSSLPE